MEVCLQKAQIIVLINFVRSSFTPLLYELHVYFYCNAIYRIHVPRRPYLTGQCKPIEVVSVNYLHVTL